MRRKKNRLMLLLSLLLVAGFLITSLASYFVSLSSLRSQISQKELPLTSDNIYSEIQRDLLRPIFISSFMASDTFLRDWVIRGEKDVSKIARYLMEIKTKYKAFTSFFVSEKTRNYYYPEGILKKVKPDEPRDIWYFRVRKMKAEHEINFDPALQKDDALTIFVNYRVFDYDGNYIGATGVGLELQTVKELIESYQKNYGSNIYFVNKKGKIMLHGDIFPSEVTSIFDIEGISQLFNRITSSDNNSFRYRQNRHVIHVNTRYIPEFKWYLIVERAEEKTIKDILYTLFINLIVCLAITILVLTVTYMTISGYQARLEKMATTDKLTGIYNRNAFDIILDETIKESQRTGEDFSIIMFDIDHFKEINDKFGHLVGDEVLKHVIAKVQNNIRKSDVCCRWGGEEFLILLKKCNLVNAYKIAEKIRKAIKENPYHHDDKDITITVSLGVSQFQDSDTADELINRVDHAMYRAKQNGRDRTETEPAMV